MAAGDYDIAEATETDDYEVPEIDQPDTSNRVSLDQLLNEGTEAGGGEEGAPAQEEQTDNADQSETKPANGYRTQEEFDKAFGKRAAGLRKQWEREHSDDLEVANVVRRRYGGKSAAEIQEAMILEEAKELAINTGYSEEEAVNKVRARIEYDRRASLPANSEEDAKLERIAVQLNDFQEKYGVDLAAAIEKDRTLLDYDGADEDAKTGNLRGAMLEYLARNGVSGKKPAQQQTQSGRRAVPRVETAGAARSAAGAIKLTDADIDRIDEAAKRGYHVKL